MPTRRPVTTLAVCEPIYSPSRMTSRHQTNIVRRITANPMTNRVGRKPCSHEPAPRARKKAPIEAVKGHGLSSTRWNGVRCRSRQDQTFCLGDSCTFYTRRDILGWAACGGKPANVFTAPDALHPDRHEGVVGSADFGALAICDPRTGCPDKDLAQSSRSCVDFDPKPGHGPGVEYVGGCDENSPSCAERHNKAYVYVQNTEALVQVSGLNYVGIIGQVLQVYVFIGPVPLMANDLDPKGVVSGPLIQNIKEAE